MRWCIAALLWLHAAAWAAPQDLPYTLSNTVVHKLPAPELGRDYEIFVSVPKACQAESPCPAVFVTDADYAFPLVRAIAARVGGHSKAIAPFILVGLSYAVGDTPEFSRRRDYTPSDSGDSDYVSDMPGRSPRFGEAEGYRRYLENAVLPFVAQRYRIDRARTVFVGHSYGGLLGAHIVLQSPALFSHYVISSPSLWFNKRWMFEREKALAGTRKALPAKVFFSAGAMEAGKGDNMVADVKAFEAALRQHRYAGLQTQLKVFAGHDHLTVFPDMVTTALKWALPGG